MKRSRHKKANQKNDGGTVVRVGGEDSATGRRGDGFSRPFMKFVCRHADEVP